MLKSFIRWYHLIKQLQFYLKKNLTKKILDVGTGVGNFISILSQALIDYEEMIGIDTSSRAIEIARNNFSENKNVYFLNMDAEHISYCDGYFDVVCLSNSLHHLKDATPIFNEIERVLKPQGLILIHEMIREPLNNRQESHKLIHHFSAEIDRYLGHRHDETYSKEEIEEKLSKYSKCSLVDTWIPEYPDQAKYSAKEIKKIILSVDQMVLRIKDEKQIPYFRDQAESIKQYIAKNGFELATQYMFILRKE